VVHILGHALPITRGLVFGRLHSCRNTGDPALHGLDSPPVPGEQVRFCLFELRDCVAVEDTESIYVQYAAAGQLTQSTMQGPRSADAGRLHPYREVARS
jgi:hypothetical protein